MDFEFNGKTDGFSFQQEVRDWFDEFIAGLDEEFENLSLGDQVIQIDLLELEVSLDARDWRGQASDKIIRQLKDKIRLMKAGEISAHGLTVTTPSKQFEDYFLHYLEYGYLPWPSSGLNTHHWNENLKLLVGEVDQVFLRRLTRLLLRSTHALQRFIHLLPVESFIQMIEANGGASSTLPVEFLHDLALLIRRNVFDQDVNVKRKLYHALASVYSNKSDIPTIVEETLAVVREKLSSDIRLKERFIKIRFRSQDFISLTKSAAEVQHAVTNKKTTSLKKKVEDLKKTPELDKVSQTEVTSHESIFIANAGLVIVAPFLPGLFERLKLSKDGVIIDERKAVGVSHFLATGREDIQEYELPLAKILCGVPVQKPMDVSTLRFTKKMKSETENVLLSVIEHWNILGSTSTSGLQESFLKRNGKLHFDGRDWLLQVEQQPYDMLLQHLPWTLSMIRLSWMQHMLKTEWVY